MSGRLWLTVVICLVGVCTLTLSIRWIATTDRAPWRTVYRRYGNIDQRWLAPIGIGVDTIYIGAGVANDADAAYWVGMAAIAAVQIAMVVLTLVVARHRNGRRTTP